MIVIIVIIIVIIIIIIFNIIYYYNFFREKYGVDDVDSVCRLRSGRQHERLGGGS